MKDLNKIEEQFKSLSDKQEATPPSFIWDELDKELPKKNRTRSFLWFFVGFSILGLVFIQQQYFGSVNSNANNQSYSSKDLIKKKTEKPNSKESITATVNNNEEKENYKSSRQIKSTVAEVISNQKIESIASELKETTIREEQLSEKLLSEERNKTKLVNHELTDKVNSFKTTPTTTSRNIVDNKAADRTITKLKDDITIPAAENKLKSETELVTSELVTSELAKQSNKISEKTKAKLLSPANALQESSIVTIDKIGGRYSLLESTKEQANPYANKYENVDLSKLVANSSSSRNRIFIEIGSLLGSHNTHLSEDTLSNYRLETESNWYTWGAKMSLGYQLSRNFYVKSGISFLESRDKFNFESESFKLVETGDTIPYSTVKTTYYNKGDITYRQWSIPLTLGYERQNGKLVFGIEGTAMFNMSFKSEGKTLLGPNSFSRVENEGIYRTNLGIGYSGALLLGIKLNDSSALYAKPSYARYLSKTSLENAEVESKLSQYYLEIAFRKYF